MRKQSLKDRHPAGLLAQLKPKGDRYVYLASENGICMSTEHKLPARCIVMVVRGYQTKTRFGDDEIYEKDWGVFLAGDKLIVAQWKYFERLAAQ